MIAVVFAAMAAAGRTTPSAQPPPPAIQEEPTPETSSTVEGTETVDNIAVDVETQSRFDKLENEIRRKLLDDRADTIDWWLTATAIFLTSLGVLAAFLSIIGFNRFREIEAEARENVGQSKKYAEEAQELVEKINEQQKQAEEAVGSIMRMRTADSGRLLLDPGDSARGDEPLAVSLGQVQREPGIAREAEEAAQEVRRNPEASLIDRAIADAYLLQRAGRIDDAIEKWRSIANVTEGSSPDIAALAWLSVGSLLYEKEVEDGGEQ